MEIASYKEYISTITKEIMAIDSPSGYCHNVISFLGEKVKELGFGYEVTNKGCAIITVEGKDDSMTVGLSAHVDTLGLMVRSIAGNGEINFTNIGGPLMATLDGEYCRIHTRDGKTYTGTIISKSPAVHVHPDASSRGRDADNMVVRLDEVVKSKEDVVKLGIETGNFICYDTKTVITESGFVKSRFLDDKISVVCLMTVLKAMKDSGKKPAFTTKMVITAFEEIGHGASYIPSDIKEFLAVDMGCIGLDLACTEQDVSICVKDSGGPYNYELTNRLIALAKEHKLSYAADIYPRYGSDVGAALRAGYDIKGALIGTGVHASHGMERTHLNGIYNTIKLIMLYLDVI